MLFDLHRTPFPYSLLSAFTWLGICIFTTTFTSQLAWMRYLRLLLAVPTFAYCFAVAYPTTNLGQDNLAIVSTIGWFGLMKTFDVCVTGFWDSTSETPHWVKLKRGETTNKGRIARIVLPLPTTLKGRMAYTLDYIFATRGGSAYRDHVFDWADERICAYDSQDRVLPFVWQQLKTVAMGFIAFDILGNFITTEQWNQAEPFPLTRLPIARQIPLTLAIGFQVYMTTFIVPDMVAVLAVVIFQLHPSTWSPYWWAPERSYSLQDFWSRRWHSTISRVLYRIPIPIIKAIRPYVKQGTLRQLRALLMFAMSAAFHMGLPLALAPHFPERYLVFWNPSTMLCFGLQPLGLLFESAVIFPLTENLPGQWKVTLRRVYFWVWLVWTGRWFCDWYVTYGTVDHLVFGPASPTAAFLRFMKSVAGAKGVRLVQESLYSGVGVTS